MKKYLQMRDFVQRLSMGSLRYDMAKCALINAAESIATGTTI